MVDNFEEFKNTIGCMEDSKPAGSMVPLKEALWQCSHEFNAKGTSFKDQDFKRVWLFTNDDNPNKKFAQEQLKIIQVAKDATETGIEISLWHMNRFVTPAAGAATQMVEFNIEIFYNKILVVD